jgi:hypothetical protein
MWTLISQVYNIYGDVVDFLYWEVYEELKENGKDLLVALTAWAFLLAFVFALFIYLSLEADGFRGSVFGNAHQYHSEDVAEKGQSTQATTPITPTFAPITPVTPSPPPRSEPSTSLIYPQPFEFPFKNFRATGESFAPSHQYYSAERPRYTPLDHYKASTASETTPNGEKPIIETSAVSEDAEPVTTIEETYCVDRQESVAPPQPRPVTPPPTRTTDPSYSIPNTESVQTSLQLPCSTYIQMPPPPPPSSPETIRRNALILVAQEEPKIQEQMARFLDTISTGARYESSAAMILDLMHEAQQYLQPFFPNGLSNLPLDCLIWSQSIITFWEALSPYGWNFLHHPDSRVPEFIKRYRHFAIWFGLESFLREFQFIAPYIPEPVSAPPEIEPQFQEQPQVAQISSPSVMPPTSPFTSNMGNETSSMPPPKTPSRVPKTPQLPQQTQPTQPPNSAPLSFTYTMTPVSSSFSSQKGKRAPKPPLRTSRTSQPLQRASAPPPAPAPTNPNLLDFSNPDWYNKPDDELNALTWTSFDWPSPAQGQHKIWSHSMLGRLALPRPSTQTLPSSYVKAQLAAVAADFKRASVVLRLQARDCPKPCEDDLGMSPLFGEVMVLIEQAADFTEGCDELVVWDAHDEWYRACVYFRDAVREDKAVWEALCAHYGPGKYRPLRKAWKEGSTEWLLLDADVDA